MLHNHSSVFSITFESMKAEGTYYYGIESSDLLRNDYLNKTTQMLSCRVRFIENFRGYDINFMYAFTNDILREVLFSYGSYIEKGNQIILTDEAHNFKMYLTKQGNSIRFAKRFNWFTNRIFELTDNGTLELGTVVQP